MNDSPSAILVRAADLIRDTAAAATPGPWVTHDTWLDNGGYTATVLSGEPGTGGFERLRAWLPSMSQEPWDKTRNVWNDARWIALMSPAVAPMIEETLRAATGMWRLYENRGWSPEKVEAHVSAEARAALALARAVLGEKEETDG